MNVVRKMTAIGLATSVAMLGIGIYEKDLFSIVAGTGFSLMFIVGYKDSGETEESS